MTTLQWLGTAGFRFKTQGLDFAFDPFLSRKDPKNSKKLPVKEFSNLKYIFVGHGHFDHIFDIPAICGESDVQVFASPQTVKKLISLGVDSKRLKETDTLNSNSIPDLKIQSFTSRHVRFDWPLVKQTLTQCGPLGCLHVLHLGVNYPAGGVRSYYFEIGGKKILFASSAGCTKEELQGYAKMGVDIFLAPLQGHSNIQDIAAQMTTVIRPKVVIPHHHDNFYAPMSQEIDLDPFKYQLKTHGYGGEFLEVPLFGSLEL